MHLFCPRLQWKAFFNFCFGFWQFKKRPKEALLMGLKNLAKNKNLEK
jgi:hypothetical protein